MGHWSCLGRNANSESLRLSWSDRPIRAGDPFIPRTPCVVTTSSTAWLFQPTSDATTRWTRVPVDRVNEPWPISDWHLSSSIIWYEDGPSLRLQILNQLDTSGVLTGHVIDVAGVFQ